MVRTRSVVRTRGKVQEPEEIKFQIDWAKMTDKGKFILELNTSEDLPEHQPVNVILETKKGNLVLGEFSVEQGKVKVELDLCVEGSS